MLYEEALNFISQMSDKYQLSFTLLYDCGLLKAELLELRVRDIDFAGKSIFVFRGKDGKDRVTMLPDNLVPALKKHIESKNMYISATLLKVASKPFSPKLARKYPCTIG